MILVWKTCYDCEEKFQGNGYDYGYRAYWYICDNCNTKNSFRIFLEKEELQEIILNNAKLRRK